MSIPLGILYCPSRRKPLAYPWTGGAGRAPNINAGQMGPVGRLPAVAEDRSVPRLEGPSLPRPDFREVAELAEARFEPGRRALGDVRGRGGEGPQDLLPVPAFDGEAEPGIDFHATLRGAASRKCTMPRPGGQTSLARRDVIKLYAFLGNYGREYSGNRHNVAWQFLESLPFSASSAGSASSRDASRRARPGGPNLASHARDLHEPLRRLGGRAHALFTRSPPAELLAIHDELEMPFGSFGLKLGGGLGGHNGLRSLEARLGTRDYARLRFGIGRPDHADIAGYVSRTSRPEEREILAASVFPAAARLLEACSGEGFEKALAKSQKVKAI